MTLLKRKINGFQGVWWRGKIYYKEAWWDFPKGFENICNDFCGIT